MHKDNRELQILVIEDNVGDYILVEEYISEHFSNFRFNHQSTASGAINVLNESRQDFDVILLDLTLPDKNGEELIQIILNHAGKVPVIVLTGYSDLSYSVKSLSMGVSDYLLKDDLSSSLLYKSIIYSIERNVFSNKIKESESNYRDLFELSPEPMMLFDLETYQILNVNNAAIENYGYSKEEFLSMTVMDLKPSSDIQKTKEIIDSTRHKKNIVLTGEHKHIKKNGNIIVVEIHASTLMYNGRDARIVLARDVTEKRREEARLRLLESVITNSTEAVVILEGEPDELPGRRILYVNKAFTKLTGYTSEEVLGRTLHFLNGPDTDYELIERLRKNMQKQIITEVEFINYRKDDTPFWIHTTMVPVFENDGSHSHWVAIGRNITERKKYERELRQSLNEKEVLLSEIHHRVKNNLAVVSGMLQLQAIQENNRLLEDKLHDSIFRISTMATIHEILYQSGSFSRLNFSEIIYKLVESIHSALQNNRDIHVDFDKSSIELNINLAIPCSLIVNEVITNIYKHAFRGVDTGTIQIELQEEDDAISLTIKDDGVGLPDDFDPDDTDTLGKHLIKILSQQLNADYELSSNGTGTLFSIRFAKKNLKGSGNALL